MNCTPFVRQCGILSNERGVCYAQRRIKEKICARIQATGRWNNAQRKTELQWKRRVSLVLYGVGLEHGKEPIWKRERQDFRRSVEEAVQKDRRRCAGRSSATESGEWIPKKLVSLGFGRRAPPAQRTQVVQKLRQRHSLDILLTNAQLPRATFWSTVKTSTRPPRPRLQQSPMKTKDGMDIAASP